MPLRRPRSYGVKELMEVRQIFKTYGNGAKQVEVLKESISPSSRVSGQPCRCIRRREDHPAPYLGYLDRPTSGKVVYEGKDIFCTERKRVSPFSEPGNRVRLSIPSLLPNSMPSKIP